MANKKITELPAATVPLNAGDILEIVQGGVNKQVAKSDVATGGGGDALTTNPLSQFAATTSAQLAGVISDETGSGLLVFGTSPTLVTPALGTPSAVVLTNGTGLPGTAVINTPAGGIAATTAQAAINELDTEKAPIVSPTFTGTPAAPTAAQGTNTTQLASTAFVQTEVATKYDFLVTLLTFTASHTLDATDLASVNAGDQLVIRQNVASANNLEIPLNATQAFPVGTIIGVRNMNTGIVTITAVGGVTLTSPLSAFNLSNQWDMCYIEKTATNTWVANGQLSL